MKKQNKITDFNPNSTSDKNSNLFGLPFNLEESDVVIFSVPWEVTCSYRGGTSQADTKILEASYQVDLIDPLIEDAWEKGIYLIQNPDIKETSDKLRPISKRIISDLESGVSPNLDDLELINNNCHELNLLVKQKTEELVKEGKTVGLLGGDHSTSLGYILALSEIYDSFSILQIDSHCDLRKDFEGFKYSHASVMRNAIEIPEVKKLVQVGIRDFCEEELEVIEENSKIETFFDRDIKRMQYIGKTWDSVCDEIISKLGKRVYLSFDIDGLDPKLCPGTGTPVPGGFEMDEIIYLIEKCIVSGIEFIGFDLNEISGEDEFNYIVGARLLWRISNLVNVSKYEKVA